MGKTLFHFKQFSIAQDHAAMKVGTDGVLLGAWASHPNPLRILDIGTGTGLIALMLAQRYPQAHIEAIEIDEAAWIDARSNFAQSPWKERLHLIQEDINLWVRSRDPEEAGYDLIVSNPPFFTNDLLSPSPTRSVARHQTHLSLPQLMHCAKQVLSPTGRLALILPVVNQEALKGLLPANGLHLHTEMHILPKPASPANRIMLLLSQSWQKPDLQSLTIYVNNGSQYSDQHRRLTEAFYLDNQKNKKG